ncbi:hypothetical protein SAMN04488058_10678 [Deinococcus reticulitermitis]|uniref:Sigma E regulatory protein, MucB/RseB n=1 Tax=Deinococcus reticulitermitis TaxID=856736 RepID=A0A1H6Y8D9_9DEIO|nr:transcriptional regulator [Deinococcus reticulitermitis]SEJ33462.1 hypothetical protein SAMN04488058_10678 [Deinococcus reticulitermitis]
MVRRRLSGLLAALLVLPAVSAQNAAPLPAELSRALNRSRSFAARGQVEVTVLFPPRAVPTRQVGQLPAVPFRPGMIARNFTVSQSTGPAVAGRSTTRYDLTPRNPQAPRWTLWIDQAWAVPLAFEERSAGGAVARRATFQKVNAGLARVERPVPAVPEGLRAAVMRTLPGLRFPDGFVPVALERAAPRWQVTLSDGLNTLSLVTAPRDVKAAPGVASRQVGGRFVWLTGNLPQEGLSAALSGIRKIDEAALGTFLTASSSSP